MERVNGVGTMSAAQLRPDIEESGRAAPASVVGVGRVVLLVILMVMELMWLAVVFTVLNTTLSLGLDLRLLMGFLPASLGTCLVLGFWHPRRGGRLFSWAVMAAIGAAAVGSAVWVGGSTTPVGVLVGGAILWVAGMRLGWLEVRFPVVLGEFQFGLIMLLVVLFVGRQLSVDLPAGVIMGIAFVVLGLLGLGLARSGVGGGGLSRGRWWLFLGAGVLAIVVVGLVVAALVTPDALRAVGRGFLWLWHQIDKLIAVVGGWFPEKSVSISDGPEWSAPGVAQEDTVGGGVLPESVLRVVRIAFTVFVIVMASLTTYLLTTRAVGWVRRRAKGSGSIKVERLHGAFGADVRAWLSRWWDRIAQRVLWLRRSREGDPTEATSVRDLYRHLLRWAAGRGCSRDAAQTPFEFQTVLVECCPEGQGEIDILTQAYVHTRYGPRVRRTDDIQALRAAWGVLRRIKPVGVRSVDTTQEET